ncbi:PAS domain-containing protein [Ktedonosporobacter rubrisoli]|uniref:histidine kinase n=1 Tax=Ktedonosporobacter rubrisoli TaxID=2509675 RepID=A0A4V0Z0C0_KTERU|nr:ATP-binding protein [Ktedonosporobacter rubrisoli]QBD82691.1 PAS domain-containing protein [Ktedonosporobacter rubrisoli]
MHITSHTNAKDNQTTDIILEHLPTGVALYDASSLQLCQANALFHTFLSAYSALVQSRDCSTNCTFGGQLPESGLTFARLLQLVAERDAPYTGRCSILTPDNTLGWSLEIHPIHAQDGHIIQLLVTTSEIAANSPDTPSRSETSPHVPSLQAPLNCLRIIELLARKVHEALSPLAIGQTAIHILADYLPLRHIYIHTADAELQMLHLLTSSPSMKSDSQQTRQAIPYSSHSPLAEVRRTQKPIIVQNGNDHAPESSQFSFQPGTHCYICIPLYFKDQFQGTLTATFDQTLHQQGEEVQILTGCAVHLASALAQAHQHATVENKCRRLHALLDQLPLGIAVFEHDHRLSYLNSAGARISGIPASDLPPNVASQSSFFSSLKLPGQPASHIELPHIRALHGETVSPHEYAVTQPTGKQTFLRCSAAPLKGEEKLAAALLIFQNLTRDTQLEQQADFLSIASHELRTPITAIQGFVEILQMQHTQNQGPDSPRFRKALDSLHAHVQHLTRLINEMLDLTMLKHSRLPIYPSIQDLRAILTNVIETYSLVSREHRFSLKLGEQQTAEPLIGPFDKDRIIQVLNNLISNAIKYSPKGCEIEVGLRRLVDTSEEALIWVKDQGIGIAAHELPHIFERFYRASSLDRSISGLGIGLYLVNEVVMGHHGSVWVESAEGIGSTFYVRLPLCENQ